MHTCAVLVGVVADEHIANVRWTFEPALQVLHLLIQHDVVPERVAFDQRCRRLHPAFGMMCDVINSEFANTSA